MPHPSYSLDLTWVTLYMFPGMKKVLKREHLAEVENMKQKLAEALKGMKIDEFKTHFEQREKSLGKCIASNGEYFEGDWSLNM